MYIQAVTRRPGSNFASGLTSATHQVPPNYQLLLQQHQEYIDTLVTLGLEVIELPELEEHPDAYFVEDVAVITPEIAVITNPGAPSRQGETDFIAPELAQLRPTRHISDPGRLDGGDVLQVEGHFFIGLSDRTNQNGAQQLGDYLGGCGYSWSAIPVGAGLHLKSSINYLAQRTVILTEALAAMAEFSGFSHIIVPPEEQYAANTLYVNQHILTPRGYPQTREKLKQVGLPVIELDMSEVAKMDGGLTCLSLRF